LGPRLELEADLGIDSIKRIEILGALNRKTGLVGPEHLGRVSSLKTIAQIVAALEGDERVGSHPASPPPLVGEVLSSEPGLTIEIVREFELARDPFLKDHALGGRISARDPELPGLPLIPLAFTVEAMAETAAMLAPGATLTALRDIRASQWLAL